MVERDHGGNLDEARAQYGGEAWIDLSTGINRSPYPVPAFAPEAWTRLPGAQALSELVAAAADAYGVSADQVLPVAGAQAAIQLYPRLRPAGDARVIAPTYNEHAASLVAHGWSLQNADGIRALAGADLAVVVNPNNPDGRSWTAESLEGVAKRVGFLVVDESFADPHPERSAVACLNDKMLILRSFGKFYGLAGARLGVVLAAPSVIGALRQLAGPWSVSGPAMELGARALRDTGWQSATTARLHTDAERLDACAARAGWPLVGGTALFRTYATPDAERAQDHLARRAIWSRRFPYSKTWLRLGLPHGGEWARVEQALSEWRPV